MVLESGDRRRAGARQGHGTRGVRGCRVRPPNKWGWVGGAAGRRRPPPFHELAWAGYVTSTCRAMVLRAVLSDLDSVIAFETDAVFTTCPLPATLGSGRGEWEETAFSSLAYEIG